MKKKLILFISIFFLQIQSVEAKYSYTVAFQSLPSKISSEYSSSIDTYFILRQLNETLFYLGTNGYRSAILKEWQSLENNKKYKLCILPNISFSNDKYLTAEELKKNIEMYSIKLTKQIKTITAQDSCVLLEFNESYPTFLAEMDNYAFPIIDTSTMNDKIIQGISPYFINSLSDNKIQLLARKKFSTILDVTEINFINFSKNPDIKNIDELNFLRPNAEIIQEQAKMNEYFNNYIKGSYLFINLSNKKIRSLIWNCVDVDSFLAYVSPLTKIDPLNSILPAGIPFVEQINIDRKCKDKPLNKKEVITFVMGQIDDGADLRAVEYLNKSLNKFNISVSLKTMPWGQYRDLVGSKSKNYDLTMSMISGRLPHHYLSVFLYGDDKTRRVSDYYKVDFEKTHVHILENSTKWKNEIAKLTKKVIENKNVLPLGIRQTKLFYPKNIILPNVESYFDLMEYKIKDIKIK